MKQSVAKTLGVAALGVAFTAAGAGVAAAAPSAPGAPSPTQALDQATQKLPVEKIAQTLPATGPVLTPGAAAQRSAHKPAKKPDPLGLGSLNGLLGGLPVNGLPVA